MDQTERRLRWVQQNKTRGRRAQRLGEVAQRVVADPRLSGPTWRRRLLAVLAEHVGSELLDYVRVSGLSHGVLQLEVTEPAVLYHLRMQWEQRIVEVLQSQLPEAGVHTVRFLLDRRLK